MTTIKKRCLGSRLGYLFVGAITLALGAIGPAVNSAEAKICDCLPISNHLTAAGAGFKPTTSNHCAVALTSTQVYPLNTNAHISAYLDYNATTTNSVTVQGCHQVFNATTVTCGTATTTNPSTTGIVYDISFSMTNVSLASSSVWDYYYVDVSGASIGSFCQNIVGVGLNIPQACGLDVSCSSDAQCGGNFCSNGCCVVG